MGTAIGEHELPIAPTTPLPKPRPLPLPAIDAASAPAPRDSLEYSSGLSCSSLVGAQLSASSTFTTDRLEASQGSNNEALIVDPTAIFLESQEPQFGGKPNESIATPLHYACISGRPELVAELLARGAVVDECDDEKWTALHYCAEMGHVAIAEMLLAKGASRGLRNVDGRTPAMLAHVVGQLEVAKLLDGIPAGVIAQPRSAAQPSMDDVKVWVGTWNMHGKPLPETQSLGALLSRGFDVYAFGSQECETSIQKALVFSSKTRWEARLQRELGAEFCMLRSHTLQAMHLAVLVRKSLLRNIRNVMSAHVATGLGDRMGNKGGIGISFDCGAASFLFVSAHFAAHQTKVALRNKDYARIDCDLVPLLRDAQPAAAEAAGAPACASDAFDFVFWCGDLNYRIDGDRAAIEAAIAARQFDRLKESDQLQQQRSLRKVFSRFSEGAIAFAPTYKFDHDSDVYDTSSKRRIPAWTDRVLYKAHDASLVTLVKYDSCASIRFSDHRPVFAHFAVSVRGIRPTTIRVGTHARKGAQSAVCAVM